MAALCQKACATELFKHWDGAALAPSMSSVHNICAALDRSHLGPSMRELSFGRRSLHCALSGLYRKGLTATRWPVRCLLEALCAEPADRDHERRDHDEDDDRDGTSPLVPSSYHEPPPSVLLPIPTFRRAGVAAILSRKAKPRASPLIAGRGREPYRRAPRIDPRIPPSPPPRPPPGAAPVAPAVPRLPSTEPRIPPRPPCWPPARPVK